MRTITIPIDLDTALELLAAEPVLIELKASGPGVNVFVEAMRVEQSTVADVDPPPAPAPKPVAKKAAPKAKPAAKTSNAGETCSTCGRVFGTAHALTIHRARSHKTSPVAAVPPLPPTPISQSVTGPPPARTTPPAAAPTRPSTMCDRGDHTMCATARARCSCSCHGKHGQQPPASAAS